MEKPREHSGTEQRAAQGKGTAGAVKGGEAARPGQSPHDAKQGNTKDTPAQENMRSGAEEPQEKTSEAIYGPGF